MGSYLLEMPGSRPGKGERDAQSEREPHQRRHVRLHLPRNQLTPVKKGNQSRGSNTHYCLRRWLYRTVGSPTKPADTGWIGEGCPSSRACNAASCEAENSP